MFKNSTVFVLGAGASWHYGYPTGEALVGKIIGAADRFSQYCDQRISCGQVVQVIPNYVEERMDRSKGIPGAIQGWSRAANECHSLIERLQTVRPLLIDHFLAWNESLRSIGKLMIAAAILECEAIWLKDHTNQNRIIQELPPPQDDWYRFIVHKLAYGCRESADLLENNVRFITFNYDSSLESHLFAALSAIDIFDLKDIERFLADDRIIHVYGAVHDQIPKKGSYIDLDAFRSLGRRLGPGGLNFERDFEPPKMLLDRCLASARHLRTIDPHDKEEDKSTLECARRWVADASVVYILGYGFDENNSCRIGLEQLRWREGRTRAVMFTNFENRNTVNKKASHLFFGSHDKFLIQPIIGDPTESYIEMSTRNVYDALDKDFDALEARLIAETKI